MKAFIFAAGLGTRLKPLTDTMPKALVPVGGKPLLDRTVENLKKAGIDEFVINAHHFAGQIIARVEEMGSYGCKVDISLESERPLETGGGIKKARRFLEEEEFFLAHNVDILTNLDYAWFSTQMRKGALATLLVSRRESSRYLLFDEDMRLAGWTNVKTGEVKSPYGDIEPGEYRKMAFSGIQLISRDVFPLMEDEGEAFSIIDFYLRVAADHPIYGVEAPRLKVLDVGKMDSLPKAEEMGLS